MYETLLDDIAKLHREIRANEPIPSDEMERQAAHIFSGVQRLLLELIYDDVGIRTLESTLLYNSCENAVQPSCRILPKPRHESLPGSTDINARTSLLTSMGHASYQQLRQAHL